MGMLTRKYDVYDFNDYNIFLSMITDEMVII